MYFFVPLKINRPQIPQYLPLNAKCILNQYFYESGSDYEGRGSGSNILDFFFFLKQLSKNPLNRFKMNRILLLNLSLNGSN